MVMISCPNLHETELKVLCPQPILAIHICGILADIVALFHYPLLELPFLGFVFIVTKELGKYMYYNQLFVDEDYGADSTNGCFGVAWLIGVEKRYGFPGCQT